MEPIRLKIDEKPASDSPAPPGLRSVDFGPGAELLMNKKLSESPKSPGVADLESEMNDLVLDTASITENSQAKKLLSDVPSKTIPSIETIKLAPIDPEPAPEVILAPQFNEQSNQIAPEIAKATATSAEDATANASKGWGGFSMFGAAKDPDVAPPSPPPLSREEEAREKFRYLRRLQELEKKGVSLSRRHTMESSLLEMQGEYELCVSERERSNSVKFQGKMLMAAVTGLEYLNGKLDPFNIELDGWAEQLGENLNDYDEIFAELHEKYKSKAKMAPELKLLFQLGGSAIMVHMTNTMFKSSLPGMDDIMRQNPELMRQFTQAAVNSVSDTNPGLGGFMGSFARPDPVPEPGSGPPPPMQTSTKPSFMNDAGTGEDMSSVGASVEEPSRPEMKGPSGLDEMLSKLKPVTSTTPSVEQTLDPITFDAPTSPKESSSISVAELKTLNAMATTGRAKKRRGGSKGNTISLNI